MELIALGGCGGVVRSGCGAGKSVILSLKLGQCLRAAAQGAFLLMEPALRVEVSQERGRHGGGNDESEESFFAVVIAITLVAAMAVEV